MAQGANIMTFVDRYQSLQQQRVSSDQLIKDLLIYSEATEAQLRAEVASLTKDLEDVHLDLDDARMSRRALQQQVSAIRAELELVNTEHLALKTRNPYIIALIDGDGILFNKELVRQGVDGGLQAANSLRSKLLAEYGEQKTDTEVIVKVCANIEGLGRALRREGSLESVENLRDFALGFTQGKASFDYINVGYGKEQADSKIKGNHNCKKIILGISHDAGYAPFLNQVLSGNDKEHQVAILQGPPVVHELVATGIPIINLGQLFRPDKPIDRPPAVVPTDESSKSISPSISNSKPASQNTWAGVTSSASPTPPSPIIIKSPTPTPQHNKNLQTTPAHNKPDWTPAPRGLDTPITVNMLVLERIKRRPSRLCNTSYLRGQCAKGADCPFEHDYKATEEELQALAYLTRFNNPCALEQYCDIDGCVYGHHCPSTVVFPGSKEPICMHYGCRYRENQHAPGTIIKHPKAVLYENNKYY